MRERRNRIDENLPQPMLSPMIDMIFLLLVFFIVSTMYMTELKTVPVKLPEAAHTENISKSNFVVSVKQDGTIFLQDEEIALDDLVSRAKMQKDNDPNFAVILRGDAGTEYGNIMKIMDKLKGVGVSRFGLAADYLKNENGR